MGMCHSLFVQVTDIYNIIQWCVTLQDIDHCLLAAVRNLRTPHLLVFINKGHGDIIGVVLIIA